MHEKQVLLTPEGLKKYEEELDHLKNVRRHEIAERIKVAISFGDISENSEYEDAKNEQAFIEGKISDLEKKLSNVKIIHDDADEDEVGIGSTVTLEDVEAGEVFEYTIVGSMEADPSKSRISNESPVGRSILGKKIGSEVEVATPSGALLYRIVNVSHPGSC